MPMSVISNTDLVEKVYGCAKQYILNANVAALIYQNTGKYPAETAGNKQKLLRNGLKLG